MPRCLLAVLLSVAIALASCSKGVGEGVEKKNPPAFRMESSALMVKGKDALTYVTENKSFHFDEVLGDTGSYEWVLLLEETYHNENTPGIEGMRGTATIRAWTMKSDRQRELRWTVQEKGNEGEIRDRFYRITTWGCCDTPTLYTYYSLLSGKKLYISNSDLIEVWGNGEGPMLSRYVAFGYDVTSNPGHDPLLQYGTDKSVVQKYSVKSPKDYYDIPSVFVSASKKLEKSLNLIGSPMSFIIVLQYPGEGELRIPVENDMVRVDKAVIPKGYVIPPEN